MTTASTFTATRTRDAIAREHDGQSFTGARHVSDDPRDGRLYELTFADGDVILASEHDIAWTQQHTYEVVRTADSDVTGDPLWAVVEYVDGQPTGADAHWVRERYAHRAAEIYRRDPSLHGKPSSVLREHGMAFDPDAPDLDARYSHRDSWNRTHTDSARTLHRQTGGWTSVYDADADVFHVRSPEGQSRTYRRVR